MVSRGRRDKIGDVAFLDLIEVVVAVAVDAEDDGMVCLGADAACFHELSSVSITKVQSRGVCRPSR